MTNPMHRVTLMRAIETALANAQSAKDADSVQQIKAVLAQGLTKAEKVTAEILAGLDKK